MTKTYTVQPGDTLFQIARAYQIPLETLIRANRLTNPNEIYVNQVLRIPDRSPLFYVVRYGDTLYNIAKRYFTTVDALMEQNQLADPNVLTPGQRIRIR